jgi:hypothetical protein
MDPDTQILLSFALTFGVPIALGLRELWVLRRGGGGGWGWRRERRPTRPRPPSPSDGHPSPLPDCLIPRPLPPELLPRLAPLPHDAGGPAPSAPRRRELEPA